MNTCNEYSTSDHFSFLSCFLAFPASQEMMQKIVVWVELIYFKFFR